MALEEHHNELSHENRTLTQENDEKKMIEWIKCRIKATKFNNSLWCEAHTNIAREFLVQPSTVSLFVTVDQDANELIVCCRAPPKPSAGRIDVTYFVKAEGLILTHSVVDKIIYGTIAMKQNASSVLKIMETVLYPKIFQYDKWNKSSKQELLGLYHRFMASLTESANEESDRTKLYLPLRDDILFTDNNVELYDKNVIQNLEAIVIHWIRQIKGALTSPDHNISLDFHGPMEELKFWERRAEDLYGISKQLQDPDVIYISSHLKNTRSKYLKSLEQLTITLLEGAKEAAQNVKFLKLLQNPCDQLASLDVADMPSVMMQFLNCIRLIHLHSTNYGTIERITDLIRRVSSEIIEHCSNKISLDDIFYGDHLKAKKLLLDCIECGNIWKQTYNRMVITVNKQKEQNGSALESWKLSDPSIFAEIDAFAQRCDDLIDICDNRFQFMELLCSKVFLQSPDGRIVGRANGSAIENSITMIQDGFKNQIERLSTLDYCILNVRESRWYADYSTFKFAVKDLETILIETINRTFDEIQVVEAAAHFLKCLNRSAYRPAIKSCAEKKAMELQMLFLKECQKTRHEFDAFHKQPPLRINEPPYAGPALWTAALSANLKRTWDVVHDATSHIKFDGKIEVVYTELQVALSTFQTQKYEDWLETFSDFDSSQLQIKLELPILRKSEKVHDRSTNSRKIESNFDSQLLSILSETVFWEKMHDEKFIAPIQILGLTHQKEYFYELRELINIVVRAYNDLICDLNGTERVYADHLRALDKKFRPAFNKIYWSSKSVVIKNCVQILLAEIRDFHREVRAFHRTLHAIKEQCKIISETHLIQHFNGDKNYNQMPFEKLQDEKRSQGHHIIFECHKRITLETNILRKQFETKSTDIQQEWINHSRKIDNMISKALLNCIRSSLNQLNVLLSDQHTSDNDNFIFLTSVELQNGEVTCQPSLISLTNTLNEVTKETVNIIKEVQQVTPNQDGYSVVDETFYEIICADDIVLNTTVNIMNHVTTCARKVQEELFAFQKYNRLWKMDKVSFLRRYSKTSKQHFESDVQKFKTMYDAIQREKTFETVNFIKLDFSSLKKELCSLASYFQNGLLMMNIAENENAEIDRIYS